MRVLRLQKENGEPPAGKIPRAGGMLAASSQQVDDTVLDMESPVAERKSRRTARQG
jgi:hypothetical protein